MDAMGARTSLGSLKMSTELQAARICALSLCSAHKPLNSMRFFASLMMIAGGEGAMDISRVTLAAEVGQMAAVISVRSGSTPLRRVVSDRRGGWGSVRWALLAGPGTGQIPAATGGG